MRKDTYVLGMSLFLFIMINLLCGCLEHEKSIDISEYDHFIGTWKAQDGSEITFFHGGECIFYGGKYTWELKNNMLIIIIPFRDGENTMGFGYSFSEDYKTLTLTDSNNVYIYYKQ